MNPPPIPVPVVRDQDAEHLKLLSIFHYVIAGFCFLGMCFLGMHYFIMSTVFTNSKMWEQSKSGPPPEAFFDAFKWFYLFFGFVMVVDVVMNVLAAIFLARHRYRTLCFIAGGLNCINFPFGTVLGVFTIIVLNRDSVRAKFAMAEGARAPAR